MSEKLILKRGEGLSCNSKAWDLSNSEWVFWPTYLPNQMETFLGLKTFKNVLFGVFQCMDNSYYAQPVETLRLPQPGDPMKIVSLLPQEFRQMSESNNQEVQVLKFKGKNWKLAGDKKWKPLSVSSDILKNASVGSRIIKEKNFDIYHHEDGFIAHSS